MSIRACMADRALPRLELRMLLEHVLQRPRAWLLAHDDEPLSQEQWVAFNDLRARRLAGEPMAYLLGRREFLDFEVKVAPGVLIPRPETELLVQCGLDSLVNVTRPRVLDLGTGSGVVAIGVARGRLDAQVVATDVSELALHIAQENVRALAVHERVRCLLGSWYEPVLGQAPFDLIVSNPPYIDAQDVHLTQGDLRFEPRGALTDGHDGLADIRQIIGGAGALLRPGGQLWLEHGFDQGEAVRQLLWAQGFEAVQTCLDLAGLDRVTGGVWPRTEV